eukprot:TRINITY_DN71555_c0_g1_i1.p1 TRINITY_DN71555_c0_g1~~TRINITY_DN71555_c0_g1_i1.p1  ORF type:complete len:665 (-),score=184.41 TRINITY_DN71555_c0_g1_i1:52-1953(-)
MPRDAASSSSNTGSGSTMGAQQVSSHLSAKFNETQQLIVGEVKKYEDLVVQLRKENDSLRERQKQLEGRQKQLESENDALRESLEDAKAGKTVPDKDSSPPTPSAKASPFAASPKSAASSTGLSGKGSRSFDLRDELASPKKVKKSPEGATLSLGLQPETVHLLVLKLNAIALGNPGGKLDENFFKKLMPRSQGVTLTDFIKIVRKDLRVAYPEMTDSQVKHLFAELDKDDSGFVDTEELNLLLTVSNLWRKPAQSSSELSPMILHVFLQQLRTATDMAHNGDVQRLGIIKKMDKRGKGTMTAEEFVAFCANVLELQKKHINDTMIKRLFNDLRRDDTGLVHIWDLLSLLRATESMSQKSKVRKLIVPESETLREAVKKLIVRLKELVFPLEGLTSDLTFIKRIDRNNSGVLELDEFINVVRMEFDIDDDDVEDDEVEGIFNSIDENGSGCIDVNELWNFAMHIHEPEDQKLFEIVSTHSKIHNVCRLYTKGLQLKYSWEGQHYDLPLQVGNTVRVVGLSNCPELNGMVGNIVKFDEQSWRYYVLLIDNKQRLALHPRNLKEVDAADPKKKAKSAGSTPQKEAPATPTASAKSPAKKGSASSADSAAKAKTKAGSRDRSGSPSSASDASKASK